MISKSRVGILFFALLPPRRILNSTISWPFCQNHLQPNNAKCVLILSCNQTSPCQRSIFLLYQQKIFPYISLIPRHTFCCITGTIAVRKYRFHLNLSIWRFCLFKMARISTFFWKLFSSNSLNIDRVLEIIPMDYCLSVFLALVPKVSHWTQWILTNGAQKCTLQLGSPHLGENFITVTC